MELKHKSFFILVAILIGIGIGIFVWKFLSPALGRGIFYYQVNNDKADLFLIKNGNSKKVVSVSAREIDPGDFRPPKRSYLSNNRQKMVYFRGVGEVPVDGISENQNIVISRIIYKPTLVEFKNGKEKEINQPMDSADIVFSPNDKKIAWIKQVESITYEQIEKSGVKREVWISDIDGENAELLIGFDENLVLLKRWVGDYIYFQGLWDMNMKSIGRINTKNRQVDYVVPRGCDNLLENCQNIEFSPAGNKFLYEIVGKKDDKDITELYLGDFDKKEFLAVLTTDQIGNRLWADEGNRFFYTEQTADREGGVVETIHLVDIENQTDDVLYKGNYIGELTLNAASGYLYFLEKQKDGENFNLTKLDLKTQKAEIILTENYNKILLVQ